MWRSFSRAAAMVFAAVILCGVANLNIAYAGQKLSGPFTHENLAIYFVHGESAKGPVPLTLEEALAKGSARLFETGNVQMLNVENLGDEEVFIQSGDIVKGGRQDRVLSVSLLIPPKSGTIPISAFCVEQGRWAKRGQEDATRFASASTSMPTVEAKRAVRAASIPAPDIDDLNSLAGRVPLVGDSMRRSGGTNNPQGQVWNEVAEAQRKLSDNVGAQVRSAESESSLQLALENQKLKDAQSKYVSALKIEGEKADDVVGYVVAVNGKINSAEIYSSNGLFRKMWNKQLEAGATEALSARNAPRNETPKLEAVTVFLDEAEKGKATMQNVAGDSRLEVRSAPMAMMFEAQETRGSSTAVMSERRYFHRSILSKK